MISGSFDDIENLTYIFISYSEDYNETRKVTRKEHLLLFLILFTFQVLKTFLFLDLPFDQILILFQIYSFPD